jgi:multicomponent Na+:H+ antiporter subunit E
MLARWMGFFVLWLVLIESLKVADLLVGLGASIAATWASLYLLPPATGNIRFTRLLLLLPHLFWESVRAGVDVAARALAPRPVLHPGFVSCPLDFPPGMARNTFASITSLLPGTVACGEVNDVLVYHCLDITQPVLEQLKEEERRLSCALLAGQSHG